MAAMDFPASPTDGQVYENYVWSAATGAWLSRGVTQTTAVTSDVAPSNPKAGDMWYNSTDGVMYLYYFDGNSYQWVQFKNDASFTSTLGPRVDAMDAAGNRNYIINGAFDIWQRGTSFTSAGYTADRWAYADSGATTTISRQTFDVGQSAVAGNPTYFLRMAVSAGNDYARISQRIEGVRTFEGKNVTVSFWAKGTNPGGGKLYIGYQQASNGTSGAINYQAANVVLTSSWTRYTVTIAIPALSGTIGSNDYFEIIFGQASDTSTAAWTLDIANVQAQEGVVATDFHRSASTLQGELAACQRYYYRITLNPNVTVFATALQYSSTSGQGWLSLPVTMRIIPTAMDSSAASNFRVVYYNGSGSYSAPTLSSLVYAAGGSGVDHIFLNTGYSGSNGYAAGWLDGNNTNAYLGFTAEL